MNALRWTKSCVMKAILAVQFHVLCSSVIDSLVRFVLKFHTTFNEFGEAGKKKAGSGLSSSRKEMA